MSLLGVALGYATSAGLLASGEVLPGEALASNFRPAHLGAEAYVGTPAVARVFEGRLSLGWRRLGGTSGPEWLWYIPIDVTAGVAVPAGPVTLLAQAGPSLVVWGASPGDAEGAGSAGGNLGARLDLGGRVPTRLWIPPLHDGDPALEGVDLVVLAGFRWSDVHDAARDACAGCGFDFSAARLSVGLGARF